MDLTAELLDWYADHARDLPWRAPGTTPWAVLVSEVMLQQTPVSRVTPVYTAWLGRWPTPATLAADSPGEAVRMWGKLGYPRRAMRLHEASVIIAEKHGGQVPSALDELLALPGIGDYTARAICAFAFGQRQPVVDTNVRRVVARFVSGQGNAGLPSTSRDLTAVTALLPAQDATAARMSIALMELGATVCTASKPACARCPVAEHCAWQLGGSPAYEGPSAPTQRFAGTDRQVRGLLMDVVRNSTGPVTVLELDAAWHEPVQRVRALSSLVADGLVERLPDGKFALPT